MFTRSLLRDRSPGGSQSLGRSLAGSTLASLPPSPRGSRLVLLLDRSPGGSQSLGRSLAGSTLVVPRARHQVLLLDAEDGLAGEPALEQRVERAGGLAPVELELDLRVEVSGREL